MVEDYSETNLIIDSFDLKSTTRYFYLMDSAAIAWGSSRQSLYLRAL